MNLTVEQAKLISLWMNIQRRDRILTRKWLSDFQKSLYEKERIVAENKYFDYRFELNREQLEDKYINQRVEEWEEEQDAIEEVMNWYSKYQDYCFEMCFKKL